MMMSITYVIIIYKMAQDSEEEVCFRLGNAYLTCAFDSANRVQLHNRFLLWGRNANMLQHNMLFVC